MTPRHPSCRSRGTQSALTTLLLLAVTSAGLFAAEPAPVDVADRLQPIVDHHLFASLDGAALKLHSPVVREVVFRFDAPWEGPQSSYISILHDGQKLRMYYRGGGDLGREYTAVAYSDDGVRWTRPELGLIEFNGSRRNNLIWTGEKKAYWESHNFSPFMDARPDVPADEKWKAVSLSRRDIAGETQRVLMGFLSPDGIHWRRVSDDPIITEGGFDSHNVAFWDVNLNRYVCYFRTAISGKRNVARATSTDFMSWSKPETLAYGDAPIEQFYTNGILPYFRAPHVYLGFPMRYVSPSERNTVGAEKRKTDGLSDAVFMSSHDGLRWHRPFMEALVRPGLDPRQWGGAHGNSTPAWGLVPTGPAEMSLYWSEGHGNYPEGVDGIVALRRGAFRLDGIVSVNGPYAGGECVTRPLRFAGRELRLNLSTSAVGSVRVELQRPSGEPIEGFTLKDCDVIWGDELDRLVTWSGRGDVSRLAGEPVRLRFKLMDADVYALQFRR